MIMEASLLSFRPRSMAKKRSASGTEEIAESENDRDDRETKSYRSEGGSSHIGNSCNIDPVHNVIEQARKLLRPASERKHAEYYL